MYRISNRRYTGSKYKLLDWLEGLIREHCQGDVFFDVFAGTGVVGERMQGRFSRIILNDFLYSNEVIYKGFFEKGEYRDSVLSNYREKYRALEGEEPEENYVSENFGGRYFSRRDAKMIGYIREELERDRQKLSEKEYYVLLASLLYSMDKAANTVGHYDAYRKREHIEDRFCFELIEPQNGSGEFEIYREDANSLARKVRADVAFVDPPYNSRQYSRFYHVLENVTQWKKPRLEGTAMKPPAENMSEYCRSGAPKAFRDLIEHLQAKYIVVTYNNTYHSKSSSSQNKITLDEIRSVLSARGTTQVFEKKHPCFNAGKTEFEDHKEYVFITKIEDQDAE